GVFVVNTTGGGLQVFALTRFSILLILGAAALLAGIGPAGTGVAFAQLRVGPPPAVFVPHTPSASAQSFATPLPSFTPPPPPSSPPPTIGAVQFTPALTLPAPPPPSSPPPSPPPS